VHFVSNFGMSFRSNLSGSVVAGKLTHNPTAPVATIHPNPDLAPGHIAVPELNRGH
jgi:hypothetical protein